MSRNKKRSNSYLVKEEQEVFESSSTTPHETINSANIMDDIPVEPMAYLQGLHSGNLMQFSQQSVLREMMLQDIKTQINSLPKLENHNNGDYSFSMLLEEPSKSHWMFSIPLNKIYIRMNKTFNIDAKFKARMPIQPLFLRAFLCFVKDVSGPVLRCQNHLSTDSTENNQKMRESLLRCENPNTIYCGTAQGKSIGERYSVLVPLNISRSSKESGGIVRQTLAFSFSCQNSCFGRKETCLVFCLENTNGDVLGQQVLYLKICTCPKRDQKQDERNLDKHINKVLSGVSEDEEVGRANAKKKDYCTAPRNVKKEKQNTDSIETLSIPTDWEVTRSIGNNYRLTLQFEEKNLMLKSIEGIIEKTAVDVLRNPDDAKLQIHARHLLNLQKFAENLV